MPPDVPPGRPPAPVDAARRPGARAAVRATVTVLVSFFLVVEATAAKAQHEPFDLGSAPALVPGGAGLGTVSNVAGVAHERAGMSPCAPEEDPEQAPHAAVYRVTSGVRRLLELSVRPGEGEPRVCEVSLYRARAGESVLTDPFDAAQRATFLVERTRACATSSRCEIEEWLTRNATYYVVVWAPAPAKEPSEEEPSEEEGPEAEPPEASFTYSARVRAPATVSIGVTGHRIVDGLYHEVIRGRTYTVTARVPGARGIVRFKRSERRYSTALGRWVWVPTGTWYRTLSTAGTASITREATRRKQRFQAVYLGSNTRLSETSERLYVRHVRVRWRRYADGGVRLRVRWYHQRYRLSCEAASLRMALRFYGIRKTDRRILRRIGIDDRPRRGRRWGDPRKAFVGNYNGFMGTTGYGVHAPPVQRAATSYRPTRPAIRFRDVSLATIARYLNDGFPVVMWGAHPGRTGVYKMRWRSWEGRRVTAWSVEHTWTVIGFRGPPSRPTHFIVHDPSGRARWKVTRARFKSFTKYFDRSGVVVR